MVICRNPWRIDVPISQEELVVFNTTGTLPLHLTLADMRYMQDGTPPHVTEPTHHNWLRAHCQVTLKQLATVEDGEINPAQTEFKTRKLLYIMDKKTNVAYKVYEVAPFREIKEFLGHGLVKIIQPTEQYVSLN